MIEDVYDYLDELAVDGRPAATTIDKSRFFITFLSAIGFAEDDADEQARLGSAWRGRVLIAVMGSLKGPAPPGGGGARAGGWR